MKRWMGAAALALATAGAVVTPGAAQASSNAWYQVYQANANGSFSSIAAISRSNIWAVGDTYTRSGKTIYRPFVRHFNGSSWQAVTIPRSSGSTADWVGASGARDVWVGGLTRSSVATTVVHRWNGSRWVKIPVPRQTDLQGATVLGPDNVWAYGGSGTVVGDIFHWNGHRWQHYNVNLNPQGMSASARNNVWVSGIAYRRKKQMVGAYRWNGSGWHRVRMPYRVFNNAGPNVTTVSRSNVWIGWYDNMSGGCSCSHALRWDGRRWHTVTTPYLADPLNVVPAGKGGYWFGAQALLTGSTWTTERVPGFTGSFGGVTRVPGTSTFLLNAGVAASDSAPQKPTIFQFDL